MMINEKIPSAEHGEESARHSTCEDTNITPHHHFVKADVTEKIEKADDDSDSDNGEFITIKVTNEEGKTEKEEVDHIKEVHHKPR